MGRTFVTEQQLTSPDRTVYTVYDPNGSAQTYTVNYALVPTNTNFQIPSPGGIGNIHESTLGVYAVSSITLPNGRSYQFQYENNSYAGLTRIDLPTGGYVTYTWATQTEGTKTRRYVTTRTVNVGGQSYQWTLSGAAGGTVTDPLGNQSTYTVLDGTGAITSAKFYSGAATGTPLRQYQIEYVYDSDPWNDPSSLLSG